MKTPVFTKLPPKDPPPMSEVSKLKWVVDENTIGPENALLLRTKKDSFEKSKNPILAIEAFLISLKAGIYPPLWVLDFLQEKLQKHHDRQGMRSLDDIFKMSKKIFKNFVLEQRNEKLCMEIFRIQTFFKLTDAEATERVHIRHEMEFKNESKFKIDRIQYEYLFDLYRKRYKKMFAPFREFIKSTDQKIREEYRKIYLPEKKPSR
jgi:hypothetical protein